MIYCENIVNVTLFFFLLSPDFGTTFFFFPFSAMPLPQLLQFFFPISAMALPQLVCHNFFFFLFTLGTPRTQHTRSAGIGQRNFSIHITEIQHFLSPFSSSFSYFLLNFGNGDTEIYSLSSQS